MEQQNKSIELKKAASLSQKVQQSGGNAPAEIDLVEIFFMLVYHWKMLLLFTLIGTVVMGFYHLQIVKPKYTASTEMYITSTDSVISLSDLQLGSNLANDYLNIIKSRSVLNRVIADLGLNVNYNQLGSMISVSNPTGTHIIRTDVTTGNLSLSRDIANNLLLVSIDQIYQIVGANQPSVIDYATAESVREVTSSIVRSFAIGAVLGFVLTAGYLIIRMMMDVSIKTEEDVEKYLQLPVLSAVPYYQENERS
jgi:capsular polysaccharide biosynthesis protein